MTLRDLGYIVALAETRHFGQAAERCHVSQPTLSMQIAKLERTLGVTLFERDKRRVIPTEAGLRIVAEAGAVLDGVKHIQEIARGAGTSISGPFYLGVIPTVGPYMLPHILPELRRMYPDVALYLREEITERLVKRMYGGKLDAAILSTPIDAPGIDYAVFYVERFVAALPRGHRLAAQRSVSLEDLAQENLLLLEEGNCMRDQTLELCKGARHSIDEEFRASNVESLRQMVAAGMGCSFLPELSTVGPHANNALVEVRPFEGAPPSREIAMAWRKTYPRSEAMRALAAALAKRLRRKATGRA